MKEITVTRYQAFTGETFDRKAACREHERANAFRQLSGLTEEQVLKALSREDADLAQAFEDFGDQVRAKRLEDGDLKRQRRSEASSETPRTSSPAVDVESGAQAPSMAGSEDHPLPADDNGAPSGPADHVEDVGLLGRAP